MDIQCDYVVVGTGSAGSVVASRLSANPATAVVALEAGPGDKNRFIGIPAAFSKLFRSEIDWDYLTEPQQQLDGREIYWPRGKVLGGSSSMNAMMWVRGFAADYDEWARRAGPQWCSAAGGRVLPPHRERHRCVALRQRRRQRSDRPVAHFASAQPARLDGGLAGRDPRVRISGDAAEFACAGRLLRDRRDTASRCPVQYRRGLSEAGDAPQEPAACSPGPPRPESSSTEPGRSAWNSSETVRRCVAYAHREVVLCGGAINSPQLLMLSGIGDRDHLAEHGIDTVQHSPEVGQNLLDHLVAILGFDVDRRQPVRRRKAQAADQLSAAAPRHAHLQRRRGVRVPPQPARARAARHRADLRPGAVLRRGAGAPAGHGVVFGPILVAPESRGQITLRSADPLAKPVIEPRYLSDPGGVDRAAMMAGLRMCARIAEAPALQGLLGPVARPRNCTELNEATLELALDTCSHTLYHPLGTCRMGSDDASVVDPQLRVRGVDHLRVADASVMPSTIRGHTHAPSMLIGEKAADLIRRLIGDRRLPCRS